MKITVTLDVEPLPQDRLLAFYEGIAHATLDDRTFEITRSLTGMQFGFYEQVDGITVVHTLNIQPAIQAALESIVGGVVEEPHDMPEPTVEWGLRAPDGIVITVRDAIDDHLTAEQIIRKRVHDAPDYWTGVTRKVSMSEWVPLP